MLVRPHGFTTQSDQLDEYARRVHRRPWHVWFKDIFRSVWWLLSLIAGLVFAVQAVQWATGSKLPGTGIALIAMSLLFAAVFLAYVQAARARDAAIATGGGPVAVDPDDWQLICPAGDWDAMLFGLEHRAGNVAAVLAFGDFRCRVVDPAGVESEADSRHLFGVMQGRVYAQYADPIFPNAPAPRDGIYRVEWAGLDAKGVWRDIRSGSCEIKVPKRISGA